MECISNKYLGKFLQYHKKVLLPPDSHLNWQNMDKKKLLYLTVSIFNSSELNFEDNPFNKQPIFLSLNHALVLGNFCLRFFYFNWDKLSCKCILLISNRLVNVSVLVSYRLQQLFHVLNHLLLTLAEVHLISYRFLSFRLLSHSPFALVLH